MIKVECGVIVGLPFRQYKPGSPAGLVMPEWAVTLANLRWPLNTTVGWAPIKGMQTGDARQKICEEAIDIGAKYVWFIDDDTQVPPDAACYLIGTMKQAADDVIAVGGIYFSKGDPSEPIVYLDSVGQGAHWKWKRGDVFECSAIGTGCLLVNLELIQKLEKPWFKDLFHETKGWEMSNKTEGAKLNMTDDLYFCEKARAAGYKILADAHVICSHWDLRTGRVFDMPKGCYPDTPEREGVDIERALAIDGWMSKKELSWLAFQAKQHTKIAEVGSYLGRSTHAIASHTKGVVYAFDDWKGPRDNPDKEPATVYERFVKNTRNCKNIVMIKTDHAEAAPPINCDMVFIDGSHEYKDVRRDIERWSKFIEPGGLLCGHDFGEPGVEAAVKELLPNATLVPETSIWACRI